MIGKIIAIIKAQERNSPASFLLLLTAGSFVFQDELMHPGSQQ